MESGPPTNVSFFGGPFHGKVMALHTDDEGNPPEEIELTITEKSGGLIEPEEVRVVPGYERTVDMLGYGPAWTYVYVGPEEYVALAL